MSICKICITKVNRDDPKVKCVACFSIFHSTCVKLSEADLDKKLPTWKCVGCTDMQKTPKPMPSISNLTKIVTGKENVSNQQPAVQVLETRDVDFSDSVASFKFIYEQLKLNEISISKRFDNIENLLTKLDELQFEKSALKKK